LADQDALGGRFDLDDGFVCFDLEDDLTFGHGVAWGLVPLDDTHFFRRLIRYGYLHFRRHESPAPSKSSGPFRSGPCIPYVD